MLFGHCSTTAIGKKIFLMTAILSGLSFGFIADSAHAAIGCTLSSPAEDLKYLFPEMTSYKEELNEFTKLKDGEAQFQAMKDHAGGNFDALYETYETPYTVYFVFKGEQKIGIVHGVNVPGKGGVIQVFLSIDPKTAAIKKFFFQRLESGISSELRNKDFRAQFEGLTLADFYKHDYYLNSQAKTDLDRVAKVKLPKTEKESQSDVGATLRGIRKNLVLLDFFTFKQKFESYYQKAKGAKKP